MKTPLYSGIITNYTCTAACRHCMFASSPNCPNEFITKEQAQKIAALLSQVGTRSVHIGGGEPFINFSALLGLIDALTLHGVGVDYIETNAFWCQDDKVIADRLDHLQRAGVDTVMASVDPFHIEHVPLERPLRLIDALKDAGFSYFVWKEQFLRKLLPICDVKKVYTREELAALLGEDYIIDTASEYGLGMNGRALNIAADIFPPQPAREWLSQRPCHSLGSTSHCHIDLYGNLVPPGCPGIAVAAEDGLCDRIDPKKYPVFTALTSGGLAALFGYAVSLGFTPKKAGYSTGCSLCFDIRRYLLDHAPSEDISPRCFYENI